jgi:hypothetical protein
MDRLYIGSSSVSSNLEFLQTLGIEFIVNVTLECANMYPDFLKYTRISVLNKFGQNIGKYFLYTSHYIDERIENNKAFLVHCMQGRCRSATIVIAYLIWKGNSLRDAYSIVKTVRNKIFINKQFFEQLIEWEKECSLCSYPSMSIKDYTYDLLKDAGVVITHIEFSKMHDAGLSADDIATNYFNDMGTKT